MKTVLLLFGGASSEHEVSIASAKNVARAIPSTEYTTLYGYIDRHGDWWLVDDVDENPVTHGHAIQLDFDAKTLKVGDEPLTVDVVFPCLHGKNGEDGTIQSVLQDIHVPYVGCGVEASQNSMNKIASKQVANEHSATVVPYEVYTKGDAIPRYDELANKLSDKLFVKPSRAGSSVGAHKVTNQVELEAAIADALLHDDDVLIEAALDPRELEVAVLGNGADAKASPVGEIVPEGEFYSYESKYNPESKSAVITPADIPDDIAEEIKKQALEVYAALGCEGLSRVDFFLDKQTGKLYFNEINTMPGFTNISMYPKLWETAGLSNEELMDQLLKLAMTRK